MARYNEAVVLSISLLLTAGAALGVFLWVRHASLPPQNLQNSAEQELANLAAKIKDRFSTGERWLIPLQGDSSLKQQASQAIANKDYAQAVSLLTTVLKTQPNDPEALIYLNNARIGHRESYTIAVAVPAVKSTTSALEILRGVAQAQDKANQKGGINGVPLKVLIVNDDSDPELTPRIADLLVSQPEVLGVVGHFSSDATLAAVPAYESGGLVMISPTSTSVQLSGKGKHIFRTVPSDRFTAQALARYMLQRLGKSKAAVFFNGKSAYSNSLKNEFATALFADGGQIVAELDLGDTTLDVSLAYQQAQQQGAEVIVLLTNMAILDKALQVVAINRKRLPLLGGDSLYNPKVLQIAGGSAAGMVVAVPWMALSHLNSPFVKASRQYWRGDVNWPTAMSYDATVALIQAIQAQGRDRTGIANFLRSNTLQGSTNSVQFMPGGDRNLGMELVEIRPHTSQFGYSYFYFPVERGKKPET
ncbi:MAG: ABC transporter substrate-binding protein [Pseudanabaenaceae cyanobacterium]